MISLGQLIVTLLLIAREITYLTGAFILIRQWLKAKARYYSDLPFLFSLTMLIMCIYTPIETIFVAFYPLISVETSIGRIAYLIDLNLITLVLGIIFVMLLVIWFPAHKRGTFGSIIVWISFTELAILLSAFIDVKLMDMLLPLISLPTYITFIITFFFSYYQKRLSNVQPLLIGLGMLIVLISQIFHSFLAQIGTRFAGIYTDATWPIMISWLIGFIIMFLGFTKKAPYFVSS